MPLAHTAFSALVVINTCAVLPTGEADPGLPVCRAVIVVLLGKRDGLTASIVEIQPPG